jgi:prepilin peptidase CpaA
MGILIGVFIVAIFWDITSYHIPNLCILTGMAAGFVIMCTANPAKLPGAIAAAAIIFFLFFPFFILRGLGAGDVKLFMMTAFYIPYESLFHYLLVTMLIGATIAIGKMLMFSQSRERLFYLGRYIRKAVLTGTIDEYEVDKSDRRSLIRMSVPAFISLILMCMGLYQ